MPHCIIDYSSNIEAIDSETLMSSVYEGMCESALFDSRSIKVRANAYTAFQVPVYDSFIYILVKILSGRTASQKKMLSQTLKSNIDALHIPNLSLSIEIADMDADCYIKTP